MGKIVENTKQLSKLEKIVEEVKKCSKRFSPKEQGIVFNDLQEIS